MQGNKNESAETIKALLANLEKEENKLKVIQHQATKLESFKDVEVSLWPALLENNKLAAKWKNIQQYFLEKKEIDPALLKFINQIKNSVLLGLDNFEFVIKSDSHKLFLAILNDPKVYDGAFSQLIGRIKYKFEEEPIFDSAPVSHLRAMIDNGNIVLNTFNFNALSDFENDLKVILVKRHFNSFSKQVGEFPLNGQEWASLIGLKPTLKQKEKIIHIIPLSAITEHVLANHLTKILLEKIADRYDFDFVYALFRFGNKELDKVKIINMFGSVYTKEELKQLLEAMGGKYKDIKPGSFPRLDIHPDHYVMLDLLKDKKLVKDFPERKDKYFVMPIK